MTPTRTVSLALLAVLGAGLAGLACSKPYYNDPRGRFHMQTPMTMALSGTAKVVTLEPGNDTSIRIDSVETDAPDLDAYMEGSLDLAALGHGEVEDHVVGGLDARRLEFRGGIDLGDGLPVYANLSIYLIQDGTTVYRLACTGPDGPFESFCLGPFDEMVWTFALGSSS